MVFFPSFFLLIKPHSNGNPIFCNSNAITSVVHICRYTFFFFISTHRLNPYSFSLESISPFKLVLSVMFDP